MMGYPVRHDRLRPIDTRKNPLCFRLRNTFLEICDLQSTLPQLDSHVRARSLDSCLANSDTQNWFCINALGTEEFSSISGKDKIKSEIEVLNQQAIKEQCMDHRIEQVTSEHTTVMLRNIACRYTQDEVAKILDYAGLKGKYDFIYLPCNPHRCSPRKQSNFGYVFVNFIQPEFVEECHKKFDGRPFGRSSPKLCQVMPARIQGGANLQNNIDKGSKKYQTTPLIMSEKNIQMQTAKQVANKAERMGRSGCRRMANVRRNGITLRV